MSNHGTAFVYDTTQFIEVQHEFNKALASTLPEYDPKLVLQAFTNRSGELRKLIASGIATLINGDSTITVPEQKIFTTPDLRTKLAETILGKQEKIVQAATAPKPLVTKLTIVSGFDRDMRNTNWKLLEDTGDPAEFDASRLELVSFLQTDEPYTGGETMLKRARGKWPVNGQALVGCNWGQRHGEALLRNRHLIPVEWRGKIIVLPGTVWRVGFRRRRVACLVFVGRQWVLNFRWLDDDFGSDGWLLRLRELSLAA